MGCVPVPPGRNGKYKFEVIAKACRRLTKKTVQRGIGPDCSIGECEYMSVEDDDGNLSWGPQPDDRCTQGCACVAPDWEPEFPGMLALGLCAVPTDDAQKSKKLKGKSKKGKKKKGKKKK